MCFPGNVMKNLFFPAVQVSLMPFNSQIMRWKSKKNYGNLYDIKCRVRYKISFFAASAHSENEYFT